MAISHNDTLAESGDMGTVQELIDTLPERAPTLFVKLAAADFLGELSSVFVLRDPEHWQWRTTTHERDICRPDGVKMASRVSTVVHYFGFKNGNTHKLLDPVSMYGRSLEDVWPYSGSPLMALLRWAVSLRNFCDTNDLEVRATTGAIGAQFLTDPRFYPRARRKVPAATNNSVREWMPGNYYFLNVQPSTHTEFTASYLDQTRAHHYHAATVPLPDANQLYAHGRFTDLAGPVFSDTFPDFYGLYCLDLASPTRRSYFHWLDDNNLERQFVYSNELPILEDMGYRVRGVRAAWGSCKRDTGLPAYAHWAQEQLDQYRDAPWLKPLLLSTYGILAARPRFGESIFRLAKSGEPVVLHTGHRTLAGLHVTGKRKLEPRIANVLHRGMIEAATRAESVGLAQLLDWLGHRVLSIYADAVIVEDDPDKSLPVLIDPWRLKTTLNHLQFINQQAFMSGEMTKLPGVGRDILQYRQSSPGTSSRQVPMVEAVSGRTVYKQIGRLKHHGN